ncbi:MAG: serine/threonine protein kinase [Candidatus Obscuribacterales bacterium]|nr:serine/threonine protein kinase [Candidatus Obscuribacterales bacterium]
MDPQSLIGKIFESKYQILSLAGMGGMGAVYKAKQLDLERFVAIKLLHFHLFDDENLRQRFQREAQALSTLSNQHIAKIYSYGIWQERFPFMVLEFIDGQSLHSLLQDCEKLEWQRSLKIMMQVAEALNHAHEHGIIHRDLSPNNIMIQQETSPDFVKILDFGLAKIMAPSSTEIQKLTQTGTLLGSIKYMSPELCAGQKVSYQSDIYSFGCILYESLCGNPPHWADNPIGFMHKHINEEIVPLKNIKALKIPDSLNTVVLHSLQKDCSNRYADMKTLMNDLTLVISGEGDESITYKKNTTSSEKTFKSKTKHLFVIIPILFLALVAATLFTVPGIEKCASLSTQNETSALRLKEKCLFFLDRLAMLSALDKSRALLQKACNNLETANRPEAIKFCLYISHYYATRDKNEAAFWAWTGLTLMSKLPPESINDQLMKSCKKLCQPCLANKSKISPNHLRTILNLRKPLVASMVQHGFGPMDIHEFLDLENYVLTQSDHPKELFANCLQLIDCEMKDGNPIPYIKTAMSICNSPQIDNQSRFFLFSSYATYLAQHGEKSQASELLSKCTKLCQTNRDIDFNQLLKLAELASTCKNRTILSQLIREAKQRIDQTEDVESRLRANGGPVQLITQAQRKTDIDDLIESKLKQSARLMYLIMTTEDTELSKELLTETLERAKLSACNNTEPIDQTMYWYLLCHPKEDPTAPIKSLLEIYESKGPRTALQRRYLLYRLAELQIGRGEVRKGIAILDKLSESPEESHQTLKDQKWRSYTAAASSLIGLEEFSKAEAMVRKALRSCINKDQKIQSSCLLVNTIPSQDRKKEAIQILESLDWLDNAQFNLDPAILLMRFYFDSSDKQKADRLYQSLLNRKLKKADFNLVKHDYYMLCFKCGDYQKAKQLMSEQLKDARSSIPPNIEQELSWLWLKADESFYQRRYEDMLKTLEQGISLSRKHKQENNLLNLGSWYYRKCKMLETLNKIREAHEYFKKALHYSLSDRDKLAVLSNVVMRNVLFDGLETFSNYENQMLACLKRSPAQKKDIKLATLKALATCCKKQGKAKEEQAYLEKIKELEK